MKYFGCKVSRYDGEQIAKAFINKGWKINETKPSVFVVNGCSVTKRAEKKALQYIRGLKRENPDSLIVVSGCLARRFIDNPIEFSDYNLPNFDSKEIECLLTDLESTALPDFSDNFTLTKIERTRKLIKIQDGCNQFCTYCIVPYLRGREKSFAPNDLIEIIQNYDTEDVSEIVITGVHIGRYNYGNYDLNKLIELILSKTGIKRIRLSSIEPNEINDELIELIKTEERIANYIHIPLQSGSDNILKKMNRPYSIEFFRTLVTKLKTKIPDLGIGIDIIVGFPGESDDDFDNSHNLCSELPLSNMHIFPYSPRPGTQAINMDNQIQNSVKKSRVKKLRLLREKKRNEFYESHIGKELECLIEEYNENTEQYNGTSSNYIQCYVSGTNLKIGKIVKVIGNTVENDHLVCNFIDNKEN